MHDIYTFWQQTIEQFNVTGAIAPSSKSLAKAMTSVIRRHSHPGKILEVGAGTGVFTEEIFKILGSNDYLDICEINSQFMDCLQKRFQEDAQKFPGRIRFLPIDIQKIEGQEEYDFIISSLPLNAFKPEMVKKILEVYWRVLKPWGWLSYFEYIGIRTVKMIVSGRQEKERLRQISTLVKDFIHHNEVFHTPVVWNLPPAYARHCQKNGRGR
jgi:phospholipid N-methyltransferase